MAFHAETFPDKLAYGATGGPGFNTDISTTDSGAIHRTARRSHPRYQWDVAHAIDDLAAFDTLRAFYLARQGALYSFLFRDPFDYSTASDNRGGVTAFDDITFATGDGSTTTFQLIKPYGDATNTINRKIRRPDSGQLKIGIAGVNQASGWSLNTTDKPGEITFDTAPANGAAITWGGTFKCEVIFSPGTDQQLAVSYDDFNTGSVPEIVLTEIIAS